MKIVIVEESPEIRAELIKILDSLGKGVEIISEEDANKAMQSMVDSPPDVVLFDFDLFSMQRLHKLKQIHPKTRIFLLVDYLDPASIKRYVAPHVDFVLDRTLDCEKLISELKSL